MAVLITVYSFHIMKNLELIASKCSVSVHTVVLVSFHFIRLDLIGFAFGCYRSQMIVHIKHIPNEKRAEHT